MRIAIVGGGLSGTITCLQLLRRNVPDLRITLIERRSRQMNRGVAYSAQLSQQLLNVPAARMGLFPDAVDAFHRWSRSGPTPSAGPTDFLPRRQFGDFVQEQFHDALDAHPGQVTIVRSEATGIRRSAEGSFEIALANGAQVSADQVVLALGNAPPDHVPNLTEHTREHEQYVAWPWKHGALSGIPSNAHVTFVGSGLTMVDLVLSLTDQGHTGPVTVISRRGFLPRPHVAAAPWTFHQPMPDVPNSTALDLLRWVRAEVRQAAEAGFPWQSVIDAIRHHVQVWWQQMPTTERKAFLRHIRPFWEVHRHRMPAAVHERLAAMQREGRLTLVAGRVSGVMGTDEGLVLLYNPRSTEDTWTLRSGYVINCTGPQADSRRTDQPLMIEALEQGLVAWDDLHMGFKCDRDGAAIDGQGAVSDALFLMGPMCKATLWECTAVPEIREQVTRLVGRLLARTTIPA